MGLFGRRFESEGRGLPMPEGGAARFFIILFSQFWKLVGANLLFALFSLPLVTLPAALCALDRVCIQLYRRGSCWLWEEFWGEFRRSFKKSLLPGLFFALLLFFAWYAMSLGLTNAALPLWSIIFWTLGLTAAAAGLCWGGYFFALTALVEQDTRSIMKNAALLCMIRPGRALLCALPTAAGGFLCAAFMPLSLFLLLLILPALCAYCVSVSVYELARHYVTDDE